MRRKVVLLAFVALVLIAGPGFAATWGVGAAFGITPLGGLPQQAMLSLKVPQVPVMWGVGMQLGAERFNLGLTADWWLYTQRLAGFLNLYIGPGLYAAVPDPLEVGGRLPIGINAYPVEVFELFFEIAPTLLLVSNRGDITIPDFALQGAFGFRFWFSP